MKTDQQLTQDVQDELQWEPAVQAAQIQVQCSASVVRLTGELPSAAQCWSAERAARRVAGVRGLDLRLTVRQALPACAKTATSPMWPAMCWPGWSSRRCTRCRWRCRAAVSP